MDDAFVSAVTNVWSTALSREVGPDDDFTELSGDIQCAIVIATLLNQWLGSQLAVRDVFKARTPRRLAAALGVRPVPVLDNDDGAGVGPPRVWSNRRVAAWQGLWDATYRFSGRRAESFDTAGWFDSVTLVPMDDAIMREWVSTAVDRIRMLAPRSILDVGCGAGLLFHELAPTVRRYCAVDFSDEAVRRLRSRADLIPGIEIEVVLGEARDIGRLVSGRYDLVLLNSVIQYFPHPQYLAEVVDAAVALTTADGGVFVGDIRNRNLHLAECTSVVAASAPDTVPVVWLRGAVNRMANTTELLTTPADLRQLAAAIDRDLAVRTLVRRGRHHSVMNRFRFDALMRRSPGPVPAADDAIVNRSVPDVRSLEFVRLAEAIDAASRVPAAAHGPTLQQVRAGLAAAEPIDPEDVWRDGARNGFGVAVQPGQRAGYVDVALARGHDDWGASTFL